MKMQFHHAGRQFFFITIAIERHPKANPAPQGALSRLVDEHSRPALLPCGEIVKALLVAMHRCFPCAAISDFVIMPDHVHFLLIVDYSQDPTFSPLWATHRLMDAAEILSGFPQGTPDSRENLRARCNIMNSLAAALCSKAAEMA